MTSPIALFVYNRPWHTQQTIEALLRNPLAAESDLIIFSDGPRAKDAEAVENVRKYIRSVEGFRSVTCHERPTNNGLAKSVIAGVTEVLRSYETIIVLEDDMVTSPHFLSYMNQGLSMYADNEEVICIHGYIYPIAPPLPQSFFLRGAHCWGWATWRRGWKEYEVDGTKLLQEIRQRTLAREFDYDNAYPFTKLLEDQIQGMNDSWAIRWHASAFLKNRLTLYPSVSLVQNIGFDDSGVHSVKKDKVYEIVLGTEPINLTRIPLAESPAIRKKMSVFFKSTKPSIVKRVIRKIISWVK
jgi:hypothetical protein